MAKEAKTAGFNLQDGTTFTIEKRIPVAKPKSIPTKNRYPWLDLNIGESFFIPGKTLPVLLLLRRNTIENLLVGGCRVWRIK